MLQTDINILHQMTMRPTIETVIIIVPYSTEYPLAGGIFFITYIMTKVISPLLRKTSLPHHMSVILMLAHAGYLKYFIIKSASYQSFNIKRE